MKRLLVMLAVVAVWTGVLSTAALAKEGHVEMSAFPGGIGPGEPWDATIVLLADPGSLAAVSPPTATIRNVASGEERAFQSTPAEGREGTYDVRVVFPSAGTWAYAVTDPVTGGVFQFDPVTIAEPVTPAPSSPPPAQAVPLPDGSSDSFPLWPVLGGVLGFAIAVLALTLRGHGRPRPGESLA